MAKKPTYLSRSRVFADFLPTTSYFPGLCVSPAEVNALRLSSTLQFRLLNTTDPTHAPAFRHSIGTWQKNDFSLEKSVFGRLLADFCYFPELRVSPAVVNALRSSSTPQFSSANTADPTHAPTFRRSRGAWQKSDFSLEKSGFCRLFF